MISIIIPCFRHGDLLGQAVDSALAQTHPAVEVIVVNDGSDDDTEAAATAFGQSITYIAKENGGLSSARNAGLRRATGDYVLFLDADDLLHPEAVERLVAAASPACDRIVIMGVRYFRDRPDEAGPAVIPEYASTLAPTIFVRNHPVHGIMCPRAAIEAAGGFDESLRAVEDWDLWIRVATSGIGVVTLPWCGAFYRQTPGSMSSDRTTMARAKCRLFAKAWQSQRANSIFWEAWATAFLRSLYAVRRNCKVLGLRDELPALQAMIDEVRGRGIRVEPMSPPALRLQDAAPARVGDFLEALGLTFARVCLPSFYESCKN
jgi:GT2 family glycosyltransferase